MEIEAVIKIFDKGFILESPDFGKLGPFFAYFDAIRIKDGSEYLKNPVSILATRLNQNPTKSEKVILITATVIIGNGLSTNCVIKFLN